MFYSVLNREKFKPAIDQKFLFLISGLMWMAIGIMLCTMAAKWLAGSPGPAYFFVAGGVVAALIIHHFGFLRIVDRNLDRIRPMGRKPCVFAFMSWKSYILVAIMMSLGITLRHSVISRTWLSVIYIAIGLSLFLSSIRYFRVFIKAIKN